MTWADDCVWWHVYPLGFCGAPVRADERPADGGWPSGTPRLDRLLAWLDYAIELGASGLLLGPVFDSVSHGYDTLDHLRVDPRLGTDADVDALLAACHARGMRVAFDGVFNHVSDQHPLFLEAARNGFDGPAAQWFDIDRTDPDHPVPRVFEGHGALVRLNHANPDVVAYVARVMNHWLDRGLDGWRLDAAYAVDPKFWAQVMAVVRERHRDAWVFGEVIHGDYADFVERSGIDSVTQYELWKSIRSSLDDRNFFELDWTLSRHNAFCARFTPATFVGNHDVTRIASAVGSDGAVAALAILMTVGGIPSIYYGDEQGFTGIKEERAGGDDAIRPAFPDSPSHPVGSGADIYRTHQDLIGLRRRHRWLTTATTEAVELTNTRYVYRARAAAGDASLTVEVDITDAPRVTITDAAGGVLWRYGA